MSKISVSVTDGTNVNLTVSPRPTQTITVSRGSATQGTVTAVTANTPLSVTNGTTTPDLSISQANATTAGYLTAGDWSTFNSKVSTVSGTAPVTVTGTANAIVSMAAATDSVNGYLTSTDHATFNAKVGSITSADGSITVTGTTTRDLSVTSSPNVIVEVRNNTGATLTKGTAVYINGAIGQLPTITKAQANSDAASAQTLGLMTTDLANNANGYVTIIGLITNINTSAYTDGQQLYLSPTVAGGLTATKPAAPQHLVYVAVVEHAHITQGKLFVKVQNGYELDELHDVQIISPTNGQTITYDSATSLWKNTTPAASGVTSVSGTGTVSGISLSGTVTSTGSLTLGGSLNLSSPPAIGGTTPNTITGSIITAVDPVTGTAGIFVLDDNVGGSGTGIVTTFYIDQISSNATFSSTPAYPVKFANGIVSAGNITIDYLSGIRLGDSGGFNTVNIVSPATIPTAYNLTLPTTAGSNNQVLKTDGSGNLSWTDKFVLGAGTATAGTAPLKFTSGTNLTTAEAGAMEYDGKVAYFTPSGTARALNFTPYYFRNNTQVTLNNATGNQSILGLTNGVTLAASTIYEVECEFKLTTSGTTSHTEAFGFAGTATANNVHISMTRQNSFLTTGTAGNGANFYTTIVVLTVTAAITTAQEVTYKVRGNISVNASGTFNPVIAFSAAPGGTSTIAAGAWFRVTPLGASGSNISIGTWS